MRDIDGDGDEDNDEDESGRPPDSDSDADAGPAPPGPAARPMPASRPSRSKARRIFRHATGLAKLSATPWTMQAKLGRRALRRFGLRGDDGTGPDASGNDVSERAGIGMQFESGACMGIGPDPTPECGDEITFDLYKTGRGYSGVARIPQGSGKALTVASSPAATKQGATNKAVNMANLATSHPAVQALVPPQAKLAMAALKSPLAKKAIGRFLK